MDREKLAALLRQVAQGKVTVKQALDKLRIIPYEDLGFARIDHHRCLRQGLAEVIFGIGKTPQQIRKIFLSLWKHHGRVLATRIEPAAFKLVKKSVPQAVYHRAARLVTAQKKTAGRPRTRPAGSPVPVISAGTADLGVAEEAALTLEFLGHPTRRIFDVGVAGLHRLIGSWPEFDRARVLVVVAGMEGALASIVGGLVSRPVVAVPTSVGYGANFNGLAPLLTMLNSCAAGVAVVNIDNGFGAGYLASLINQTQ